VTEEISLSYGSKNKKPQQICSEPIFIGLQLMQRFAFETFKYQASLQNFVHG
jgi:hypothetical protein